jgi:MFS family permease
MSAKTAPEATRPGTSLSLVVFILSGCLTVLIAFGPRSAMGFFQIPILAETGWDRTTFAMAIAIQNLCWGLGQPVFGAIADRYGTARVLVVAAILYAIGLVLMAHAPSPLWLNLGAGVLVGLGVAGSSFTIILAAFARQVSPEKRSMVFGFATAAGSLGMFIFAPVSQLLINTLGWSDTLIGFAAMMAIIPVAAAMLRGRPTTAVERQVVDQTIAQALAEAFAHKSYVLLTSGFFVCGFQVSFITAHFPAYINDLGLAAKWAVVALACIGFFNVIGSLASGFIGQRYHKPHFLALIYLGRSILVTIFLLVPATPTSVTIFSVIMGLLWLSTVPPTNALVAIMFGTRHLGLLGGVVFLSHQIGSFLGVWLGGYLHDIYGTYDPVWWLGVGLGLVAAILHWPIREEAAGSGSLRSSRDGALADS